MQQVFPRSARGARDTPAGSDLLCGASGGKSPSSSIWKMAAPLETPAEEAMLASDKMPARAQTGEVKLTGGKETAQGGKHSV